MASNASPRDRPVVASPAPVTPPAEQANGIVPSTSNGNDDGDAHANDDGNAADGLPLFRYDSPSVHSGPSQRRSAKHRHPHHGHAFPDRAESLRDVQALAKLVDYRSNWYEDHRLSADEIRDRTRALGWRKAAAVTAFYERQNEILDGWREVDEILDSRFPEEVMRRFAVHDDESKKRQKSLDRRASRIRNGRLPGESTDTDSDSGSIRGGALYDGEDGDRRRGSRRLKRSFSEKAVSALSGLWFSSGSGGGGGQAGSSGSHDLESGGVSAARGRKRHAGQRRRPIIDPDPDLAEEDEDGYNEDEEEGDDDDDDDDDEDDGGRAEAQALIKDRRRGRPSRSARGYGAIRTPPQPQQQRSATELYDRIREEVRFEELRRSESTVTLPGSLQKDGAISPLPRSGSPTIRGTATPPTQQPAAAAAPRQIENIPEHAVPNGPRATAGTGLDPASAASSRPNRPFSTHSAERQALLDSVPNRDKEEEASRAVQFAININLLVNVLLLGGKGVAVVSSNSVSLIASFVDSALDLLSTVIIFATSKAIAYRSWRTFYKYPVGKKRLEPLGVVIFSVLMVASFCQVLIESAQRLRTVLATGQTDPDAATALPLVGIAFMLATIGIKTAMWLLYRTSKSSGVRAVAQDAENDVVFNLLSLTFPIIGAHLGFPALDPLGGIVLSLYIIYEWLHTLFETLQKLSGAVAPPEQVSKCIYLVTRFNSVRSVSAFDLFHAGDDYIAEADVVLPQSISLKEAHDLGEIVTYCIESVEGVERAYVHLEYNALGQPGHLAMRG
ncbi:related to cation diffusion facilitator 10 [Pseudozyma flocculosa]|uniref:Related to cation diffusion facilitator 10 n=1 Tax=Pseudozyma flocculosa TaxID=84751 RepID=A0A5C3F7U7_9BASI|nr:related to cation diffusion facilitator 10 [Pseudozyma flocculosa]